MLNTLLLTAVLAAPAEFPTALVGEWRYGTVSGTTYWDSSTGKYLGSGSGMSDTFIFAKDGSYKEYAFIKSSPVAGWTTKIFTTIEGKAKVSGDTLTLTPTKGNYHVEDNRVARSNYDRPMTDEEVKKQIKSQGFSLGQEDGKPVLAIKLEKSSMKYQKVN
jgi:hypothetical protein